MAQRVEDLQVWQKAIQQSVAIYKLTEGFPRQETYGLTSQIQRAAVSVASNIAEGRDRLNNGEFGSSLAWRKDQITKCKPNS